MHFREKIAHSRKILISNPTGLGDVVHTLPAACMIKDLFPEAQIDFLASSHSQALFELVPWIGRAFAVPEYPRPRSRWELYQRRLNAAREIRRERYDALINFRPVDKTLPMVLLSGAPHRLALRWIRHGRKDAERGYTDRVRLRWRNEPSYQFMLNSLGEAGFSTQGYGLGPGLLDLSEGRLPEGVHAPFFHLSLFASKESRQLRPTETATLIAGLRARYPGHQLVITCSAASREVEAIHGMVGELGGQQVKVFAGTLSTAELTQLLARADAHLGPETGSLPLAWLAGCRTVSWFLNHETVAAWAPTGPQHRVVLSVREQARLDSPEVSRPIQAITAEHVLEALDDLLSAPHVPVDYRHPQEEICFRFVG